MKTVGPGGSFLDRRLWPDDLEKTLERLPIVVLLADADIEGVRSRAMSAGLDD